MCISTLQVCLDSHGIEWYCSVQATPSALDCGSLFLLLECGHHMSSLIVSIVFFGALPCCASSLPLLSSSSPLPQRADMDKASPALAKGVPPGVPKSYRALADYSAVPPAALHAGAKDRHSIEEKAKDQQYLTD
ncbi:hypothetical protein CC78DRAFT_583539 [Lojkania enalia]|uniref:Uncharacterized protein n=1 Tax=Lojkania enalia TaxID=147567 RepID=A0A9P4K289_9PLEO|nr:hypothetical protein CC78DRAFT_583539 [Didymosphaeria enalia]